MTDKKLVIELELRDGGLDFERRPDLILKGYCGDTDSLARHWIGYYLDGGGEQDWFNAFEIWGVKMPTGAHAEQLRLIEVMPDGRRLVRWDWKAQPQEPTSNEAALLRSVTADLEALTDAQRLEVLQRFCSHCGCVQPTTGRCRCWNDE